MEIQLSQGGLWTGHDMKSAPAGLGLYGSGGLYQQPYVDRYRKIRTPTPFDLINQYRNAPYVCANLNANGAVQCARKLYVQTRKGDAKPKVRTRRLSKSQEAWIRGETQIARGVPAIGAVKAGSSVVGRISGDAEVEEVMDHPLLDLLAKPNPFFDGMSLNRMSILYLDIVGAAYWYIGERNRVLGTPKEIWPLPAQQVWPWREKPEENTVIDCWLFTSGRQQYRFPYKDVLQFHYFNPYEPYSVPLSPLQATYEHVTVTEQSLSHAQSQFDNQARPDSIVSPNEVIGEQERIRLEKALNSKFSGAGSGRIWVSESAMKVTPLQWSPVDLGVLDLYGVTQEMIQDAYGVPQAMCSKETNKANLEASLMMHARFGILPRLNTVDEALNRVLVPLYDDSGRLFLASDNPIKEDRKAQLDEMVAMLKEGVATRNEGRVFMGDEEEPWGDQPLMPHTMQAVNPDGKPDLPAEPTGRDAGGHGSNKRPPKPGAGGSAGNGGDGSKPKKPKKKPKKNGKSLVLDVARLSKAIARGDVTKEAATLALSIEHGMGSEDVDRIFASMGGDPAKKALKAALAFSHLPEMDDTTELRVAELWETKGKHDNLKWLKPNFNEQKDQEEIERACGELKSECSIDIGHEDLTKLFKAGDLVDLKDKTWKRIKNTESLKCEKIRDVLEVAKRNKKKVRGVMAEFIEDRVRAPMLLQLPDGDIWLVNGNTRLCISHVFDIKPKVWLAKMPAAEKSIDWRAKGFEAAKTKLAALPGEVMVSVPFLVSCPEIPEGWKGGSPELGQVNLAALQSIIPEVSRSDVGFVLMNGLETSQRSILQLADGTQLIQTGLAGFVASWLCGLTEIDAQIAVLSPPAPPPVSENGKDTSKYSSTQFNLDSAGYSRTQGSPVPTILEMAKAIPDEDLAADGRESCCHVTIKYGLHTNKPAEVFAAVANFGPVQIKLGKTSLFPAKEGHEQRGGEEFDVVKIDVESNDLQRLNKLIASSLECTDTHPEYHPHVTLAYVKPGFGYRYVDQSGVDGKTMICTELVFSNKDHEYFVIDLSKSGKTVRKIMEPGDYSNGIEIDDAE